MASDYQIDLGTIQGTGPNGRIVRRDVEAAFAKSTTPVMTASAAVTPTTRAVRPGEPRKDERIPLNKLRSAIGKRMLEAKQTIPHFYVTRAIQADRLMELRQQFNNVAGEDEKLSVNDFIVKAVAMALLMYPGINASLAGNEIVRHGHIHIGIAVTIEGGLLTIVVKDADVKDVRLISTEVKGMVSRARQGKVRTEDIEGSTFSISNLGMFDVDNFTAIINPPEAAILAVGAVHDAPLVVNGSIQVGKLLKITLSADHRVTDGAEAAQFMQELSRLLENPVWLVM
jgi:pyruvate dehydrogenase E2 component (dihydrolipoamide acetyltransferase)